MTVLDALTYAGRIENLGEAFLSPKLALVHGNILDVDLVDSLVREHTAIVHFAAESHVDRSSFAAGALLAVNVFGTRTLADAAMWHGIGKFVHVSTDEVYGPLLQGSVHETDPPRPTVPCAASKAASDLVALSYLHTYGVPVRVTRSSNNYGPISTPRRSCRCSPPGSFEVSRSRARGPPGIQVRTIVCRASRRVFSGGMQMADKLGLMSESVKVLRHRLWPG